MRAAPKDTSVFAFRKCSGHQNDHSHWMTYQFWLNEKFTIFFSRYNDEFAKINFDFHSFFDFLRFMFWKQKNVRIICWKANKRWCFHGCFKILPTFSLIQLFDFKRNKNRNCNFEFFFTGAEIALKSNGLSPNVSPKEITKYSLSKWDWMKSNRNKRVLLRICFFLRYVHCCVMKRYLVWFELGWAQGDCDSVLTEPCGR